MDRKWDRERTESIVFKTQQIITYFSRNWNLLTIESWLSERHNHPHLFIVHPTLLR